MIPVILNTTFLNIPDDIEIDLPCVERQKGIIIHLWLYGRNK
jgi:hypothetical protein